MLNGDQTPRSTSAWRQVWPLALFVAAALAFAADLTQLLGIDGSWRLVLLAITGAITVGAAGIAWRRLRDPVGRDLAQVALVRLSDAWNDPRPVDALQCMGSGSETYMHLIAEGVRVGAITPKTRIQVGFRLTEPGERDVKLLHFSRRWTDLIKAHKLSVTFHPGPDFDHALRGYVSHRGLDATGALGLYVKHHGQTYGQEYALLPVSNRSEAGTMFIGAIGQLLDERRSYPSIEGALRARDRKVRPSTSP